MMAEQRPSRADSKTQETQKERERCGWREGAGATDWPKTGKERSSIGDCPKKIDTETK